MILPTKPTTPTTPTTPTKPTNPHINMNRTLLEQLCNTTAISGYENETTDLFLETLRAHASECSKDIMGSGVAFIGKKGERPRIMLEAHADEIGFQVLYVSDSGYVYMRQNGGIDEQCLPGTQVVITTQKGEKIHGVIGKKPVHLLTTEERKVTYKLYQLWIDTGLEPSEVKERISVGDAVAVKPNLTWLGTHRVTSKSLDNRIGLYTLIESLKMLAQQGADGIAGVATVQEEVGCRGALVAANNLNPEISITIDVDFATDVPDCPASHYGRIGLGDGVVIQRNLDCDTTLSLELERIAKEKGIPYQIAARTHASGGNNASRIQLAQKGIRTAALAIPCRYMHTPVEVCDMRDVDAAIRLISEVMRL